LCQAPVTQGSDPDPLACAHVGTVLFDTTPGVVTSYTDSLVLVDVPARAPGSASIVVTVAGRSSNRIGFVVE
jgi:hypothetical protein